MKIPAMVKLERLSVSSVALVSAMMLLASCATNEEAENPAQGSTPEISNAVAMTTGAAPKGKTTYRVTYNAVGADGEEKQMSGMITLPDKPAPEGGFPIVSWAHGTTGIAEESAPSTHDTGVIGGDALVLQAKYLQNWIDRGYAVVQPDFEGLGVSEGKGTYLNKSSLSSSISGLVNAARDRYDLGDDWHNIGWSQGGFAALAAASDPNVAEGLQKTVAIAPGDSDLTPQSDEPDPEKAVATLRKIPSSNLSFFPILLGGALNANPDFDDSFLSEKGKEVLDQASHESIAELREFLSDDGSTVSDLLVDKPEIDELVKYLDSQQIATMEPKGPVLVLHGDNDKTVVRDNVTQAVKTLSDQGIDIKFKAVPNADHRKSVSASWDMQKQFLGID